MQFLVHFSWFPMRKVSFYVCVVSLRVSKLGLGFQDALRMQCFLVWGVAWYVPWKAVVNHPLQSEALGIRKNDMGYMFLICFIVFHVSGKIR